MTRSSGSFQLALIPLTVLSIVAAFDSNGISAGALLLYLVLSYALWFAALMVLNRLVLSTLLCALPLFGLVAIDKIKHYHMDDHFRWSDIRHVFQHLNSVEKFEEFVSILARYVENRQGLVALLAGLTIAAVVVTLARREPPFMSLETRRKHRKLHIAGGVLGLVLVPTLMASGGHALISATRSGVPHLTSAAHDAVGSTLFFMATVADGFSPYFADSPNVFGASAAQAQLGDTAARARIEGPLDQKTAATIMPQDADHPDLVIWVNESTFDPRDLATAEMGGDMTLKDSPAMFEPNGATISIGRLNVGIFGGKSWNTEFALQSGAHIEWFDPDTYAATRRAPLVKTTLFKTLSKQGYEVHVVYAHSGFLFDGRAVNKSYGADTFSGPDELVSGSHRGLFLSDAALAAAVRDFLAPADRKPQAVLAFTMANHGPYPANDFSVTEEMRARWGRAPVSVYDYLSRLESTNSVITDLSKDLMGRPRPAVFVHLGDHKPRLPDVDFSPANRYTTYYHLQANFASSRDDTSTAQDIDVIFLPSLILRTLGVGVPAVFQANNVLGQSCRYDLQRCREARSSLFEAYKTVQAANLQF